MTNQKQNLNIVVHRLFQIVFFVGPLTTLVVNPWTSYDPIALPKMLVLSSCGLAAGFLVFAKRIDLYPLLSRETWLTFTWFLLGLILSLSFSGAPINQQIWGSFGRNTGFVTYVSLLLILVSAAVLQDKSYYEGIGRALVFTAIPMTAYCLVQISGRDPIGWSEFATFGTLGNVNFLSAFLGMTSIASVAMIFHSHYGKLARFFLIAIAIVDVYIIYSTGSVQGIVIFVAGLFSLTLIRLFYLQNKLKSIYLATYFIILLSSVLAGTFGLLNRGPLAQFLFQPSVLYRTDYIHAGWEMTLKKPFFGVGLDSYGDWYREMRGELSTLRTGVDRISNTAHNIFLDISSNGGVMLGISYLSIIVIAILASVRFIKSQSKFDPSFAGLFSVWFAYQVQSLISINQIGVGVWGWVLTGTLIGYGQIAGKSNSQDKARETKVLKKLHKGKQLSAQDSIATFVGLAIGFTASIIPVTADIGYRAASLSGDVSRVAQAVNRVGATQFHMELALDSAMRTNKVSEVGKLAHELVAKYPRSFFGWRVLSVLTESTPEERIEALERARQLDPFNPELK